METLIEAPEARELCALVRTRSKATGEIRDQIRYGDRLPPIEKANER